MSNKSGVADNIINLPKGGGAQKGMGETFTADLFTGTGNSSVPISIPPGRNGFEPTLNLGYSTGNGNGPFGMGWNLGIPGVARKTSKGVPRYDDERDTFILSGAEDLIQIKKTVNTAAGVTTTKRQYRPRTEGLFARITFVHATDGLSFWEVRGKDGLISFYGSDVLTNGDKSKIADRSDASKISAWKLTKTIDPFGNDILYTYENGNPVTTTNSYSETFYPNWVDVNHLSINQGTGTLTCNGGTTGWSGNPGHAFSEEAITGDGYVEHIINTNAGLSRNVGVGLSYNNDPSGHPLFTIDYCIWQAWTGMSYRIRVGGTQVYIVPGSFSANDTVRIERQGSTIYFKINGNTVYSTPETGSGDLHVDNVISRDGQSIKGLQIHREVEEEVVGWAAPQNTTNASSQTYLADIQYMNYDDAGTRRYLCKAQFNYEQRPDPMSDYSGGFEVRTLLRCKSISTFTFPENTETKVKTYALNFLDTLALTDPALASELPINGASMLRSVQVSGHDGNLTESMPPLEFSYTTFQPEGRNFRPVEGADLPYASLSNPEFELTDVFGNGLPDIIQLDGKPRYWRNLGNGRFDLPKPFKDAPSGFTLSDPDVQLVDAQGDGKADLLVNKGGVNGYFPMRFDGEWDRKSFVKNNFAPSFSYADPEVKMMDMTGDGITDVVRNGSSLEVFYFDEEEGFNDTAQINKEAIEDFPNLSFADPRIKTASIVGGLQDFVRVENGSITYWPNLGYGKFARPIVMKNSPRFGYEFNPQRVLLGDIDGDGFADMVYVEDNKVTLWINQSGNRWSDPIEITGTPSVTDMDAVRMVDLLGQGTPCILWTRDAAVNRANQYLFLDLTDGVKPYVMREMNNNLGAITRVKYKPSTWFYRMDELGISPAEADAIIDTSELPPGKDIKARARTRWNTNLPFPTQCIAKTEVIDQLSRGKLVTQYFYHHGYWDGGEREFRGFAHVDQLDTETLDTYNNNSLYKDNGNTANSTDHKKVSPVHYSPPTMTKNWFHLGPVGDEFGGWGELDLSHEYWEGDANMLARPAAMTQMIKALARRARRDAFRALSGAKIRAELYALDSSARQNRPYTVTEELHGVRLEFQPGLSSPQGPGLLASDPATALSAEILGGQSVYQELKHSGHIFFSFGLSSRTTQWERGVEPMHSFSFSDDYDAYGQGRKEISIAVPRGKSPLSVASTGEPFLATYSVVSYIHKDTSSLFICDRKSQAKAYKIANSGQGSIFDLKDLVLTGGAPLEILDHVLNYYDGNAFEGLSHGSIGAYGAISKVKRLAMSQANVTNAYSTTPAYLQVTPSWPSEIPSYVQNNVPDLLGFELETSSPFEHGYYILAERKQYDFQEIGSTELGLVTATKDAMNGISAIAFDSYGLFPVALLNNTDQVTSMQSDYRTFQARKITDPNENETGYAYTPLGLLYKTAIMGNPSSNEGDDLDHPTKLLEYDFHAFRNSGQPVWVKTIRQEDHYYPSQSISPSITSIEYSDGFGRLLQSRTQAEDIIYGSELFGDSGLPHDHNLANQNAVGVDTPISGNNVVVSGWKVYNNKGKVVESYEPYFDNGFEYQNPETITGYLNQGNTTRKIRTFYDPMGRNVKSIDPMGSESRSVTGIPSLLSSPPDTSDPSLGGYSPTPWERFVYDANDLAPITHPTNSGVPSSHYYTPRSEVMDALGRAIITREHKVQDTGSSSFEDAETFYTYDIKDRIIEIRDAYNRQVFTYIHPTSALTTGDDDDPTPLVTTHIDSGRTDAIYNALGQPVEIRDAKSSVSISLYDSYNRPHLIYSRDAAAQAIIRTECMEYGTNSTADKNQNKAGQLAKVYDQSGIYTLTSYDFKGNLLQKEQSYMLDSKLLDVFNGPPVNWDIPSFRIDWNAGTTGHTGDSFIQDYSYDAFDRIKTLRCPSDVNDDRRGYSFFYNRAGALIRIDSDGTDAISEIAYNAKGQRILIAYGNEQMTRFAFDPISSRLVRQRTERFAKSSSAGTHTYTPQSGTTRQDTSFEYDLVGNILKTKHRTTDCGISGSILGSDAIDNTFSYDPLYRLLTASGREMSNQSGSNIWSSSNHPSPGNPNANHTVGYTRNYAYDKLGNLESLSHSGASTFSRVFAYDTSGSVKTNNKHSQITIGGTSVNFNYDTQGNLTENSTTNRHYRWNNKGQLIAFYIQNGTNEPSVYAQYLYDSDGNRVKKLVRSSGGQYESISYVDDLFELRTDGTLNQNSIHISDGEDRIGTSIVGDSFGDDIPETNWYYIKSHQGSNSLRLNTSPGGSLIDQEEYYPYGDSSLRTFSKKRYRYIGKEKDGESGLYYYGARYYAAWTCRFISVDPLAKKFPHLNPFNNASNSPISKIDIDGKQSIDEGQGKEGGNGTGEKSSGDSKGTSSGGETVFGTREDYNRDKNGDNVIQSAERTDADGSGGGRITTTEGTKHYRWEAKPKPKIEDTGLSDIDFSEMNKEIEKAEFEKSKEEFLEKVPTLPREEPLKLEPMEVEDPPLQSQETPADKPAEKPAEKPDEKPGFWGGLWAWKDVILAGFDALLEAGKKFGAKIAKIGPKVVKLAKSFGKGTPILGFIFTALDAIIGFHKNGLDDAVTWEKLAIGVTIGIIGIAFPIAGIVLGIIFGTLDATGLLDKGLKAINNAVRESIDWWGDVWQKTKQGFNNIIYGLKKGWRPFRY